MPVDLLLLQAIAIAAQAVALLVVVPLAQVRALEGDVCQAPTLHEKRARPVAERELQEARHELLLLDLERGRHLNGQTEHPPEVPVVLAMLADRAEDRGGLAEIVVRLTDH